MFRDRQQELERIEQQLLEEEEAELSEEEDSGGEYPDEDGVTPLTDIDDDRFYNTDRVDADPEDYSGELSAPPKRSMTGLLITVLLLTAGVLGLLAWMLLRLQG